MVFPGISMLQLPRARKLVAVRNRYAAAAICCGQSTSAKNAKNALRKEFTVRSWIYLPFTRSVYCHSEAEESR
jgi:hypothetical protein